MNGSKEQIDFHYFHGIQKKCSNCTHYRGFPNIYRKCKLNHNMFLYSAFEYCKYNFWIPNQKIYNEVNSKN